MALNRKEQIEGLGSLCVEDYASLGRLFRTTPNLSRAVKTHGLGLTVDLLTLNGSREETRPVVAELRGLITANGEVHA
jgi:hypothetical protein